MTPLATDYEAELDDLEQQLIDSVAEQEYTASDKDFFDRIVDGIMRFGNMLAGDNLYPYQQEFARRVVESIVLNDGKHITALFSRQSGKTQAVSYVVCALMVLMPKLAIAYPDLFGQYKNGFMVGVFAPVESQADTLFTRIKGILTSDHAKKILGDREIQETVEEGAKIVTLRSSRSFCRMQTANPRANIESSSYMLIVVDEAQHAVDWVVRKSIEPMGAFYAATIVKTGTPTTTKGDFYEEIRYNKIEQQRHGAKKNHFQHDWKSCAKYNPRYKRHVVETLKRIGVDSDEFQLAYALRWLLERGMFTTEERLEALGDKSMQRTVPYFHQSPIVVGIDPARKQDSTVCTALWVDWDAPDEFGYYDCRILDWLEMHGEDWEDQYGRMVDFIHNYSTISVAIDAQGVGDAVASRLKVLLPNIEISCEMSNTPDQSKRWKHLMELMNRGLIGWPAGHAVRKTKKYGRFIQQMGMLEKKYVNNDKYMIAEAPEIAEAHDDYPDSLALAVSLTRDFTMPEAKETENVLYKQARRR